VQVPKQSCNVTVGDPPSSGKVSAVAPSDGGLADRMADRQFQPSPDYGGDPPSLHYGATRKAVTCCRSVVFHVAS